MYSLDAGKDFVVFYFLSKLALTSPVSTTKLTFVIFYYPGGVRRLIMFSSSMQLLINSSLVTRPSLLASIFSKMDLALSPAVSYT